MDHFLIRWSGRLHYISASLKWLLRLFPPAGHLTYECRNFLRADPTKDVHLDVSSTSSEESGPKDVVSVSSTSSLSSNEEEEKRRQRRRQRAKGGWSLVPRLLWGWSREGWATSLHEARNETKGGWGHIVLQWNPSTVDILGTSPSVLIDLYPLRGGGGGG